MRKFIIVITSIILVATCGSCLWVTFPLFPRKTAALRVDFPCNCGPIEMMSVDYSPDGSHLAVGGLDGSVWILDPKTGQRIKKLSISNHQVTDLQFSLDGTHLVVSTFDNAAGIWDIQSGRQELVFTGNNAIMHIKYSPDNRFIATQSEYGTVKLWYGSTGILLKTFTGTTTDYASVAFSPDSKRLAIGGTNHVINIVDVNSGKQITTINTVKGSAESIAFSPNGKYIANSEDENAQVWDAATGKNISTIPGTSNAVLEVYNQMSNRVTVVKFSPDSSKLLTGRNDGKTELWDTLSAKRLLDIPASGHPYGSEPQAHITDAAFSPDGKEVTITSGSDLQVWDISKGDFTINE